MKYKELTELQQSQLLIIILSKEKDKKFFRDKFKESLSAFSAYANDDSNFTTEEFKKLNRPYFTTHPNIVKVKLWQAKLKKMLGIRAKRVAKPKFV